MKNNNKYGYTLIELMITLVVIGILATLAVPSFYNYVREARRVDATSMLQKIIAQQTLYYGNFGSTYTHLVKDLGLSIHEGNNSQTLSRDGHYVLTMSACDGDIADCVRVEAKPAADSSQNNDDNCQVISLNSRGTLGAKDSAGNTSNSIVDICWK